MFSFQICSAQVGLFEVIHKGSRIVTCFNYQVLPYGLLKKYLWIYTGYSHIISLRHIECKNFDWAPTLGINT